MSNTALVQNLYYTVNQYVDPVLYLTPQPAGEDSKLLYPIFKTASDYQIGIAKAKIPLDTIPLTQSNIPLKRYEVILREGANESTAYLNQLNANANNYLWNCSPSGVIAQYKTAGATFTPVANTDLSSFIDGGIVQYFLVDDYFNAYLAYSSPSGGIVDKLVVVNITFQSQLEFLQLDQIQGMDLDRNNQLYVANEAPSGSVVNVYRNQNSATEVVLTLIHQITTGYASDPLTTISTISADTSLLVGYNSNKFAIYNTSTYQPYTGFTDAGITHLGKASALLSAGQGSFVICDDGAVNNLFVGSTSAGIATNMVSSTPVGGGNWLPTAKFVFTNSYVFSIGTDNRVYYQFYNPSTGTISGAPQLVNSVDTTSYNNVCLYSDRSGGFFANSTDLLYAFNIDNYTTNNFYLIDSSFGPDGGAPKSYDYQNTSKKMVAVGSDGNLYISSKAIYPKNFAVNAFFPFDVTKNAVVDTFGVGYNAPGTFTSSVNSTGVETTNYSGPVGSFITGTKQWILDGSNVLTSYLKTTGALTDTYQLPLSNEGFNACNIDDLNCVILDASGNVYFVDLSNGSIVSQFTIPDEPTAQLGLSVFFNPLSDLSSSVAICINNQTKFYIYTIPHTTLNVPPTLQLTSTFAPEQGSYAGNQWIYYCQFMFAPEIQGFPVLFFLTSGNVETPSNLTCNSLWSVVFNGAPTFSAGVNYQNSFLVSEGTFPSLCVGNAMDVNTSVGELYVSTGTQFQQGIPFTNSGELLVFNVNNSFSNSSTITLPLPANAQSTSFDYFSPQKTYTWIPITATGGATTFSSVAVGQRNPNNLYVLNSAGNAFFGTIAGTQSAPTISFSSYQPPINGTYSSISLTPDVTSYNSVVSEYTISNQTLIGSHTYGNKLIPAISRNDITLQYCVSVSNTSFDFYDATGFSPSGSKSNSVANLIFAKNGVDLDAGPANIYTYQVFIDALNSAFTVAWGRLKAAGGQFASPPTATLNYETGLITLTYSTDYASVGNGILFNKALSSWARFYSTPDKTDVGFDLLKLPYASTSTTQTSKSIYVLNKLDKILFQSLTLYVLGSYLGVNSQNFEITSIDVPTDQYLENTGQFLTYQPSFLRIFQLAANTPIDHIQLSVLYQYIDGSQYPLLVNPDAGWSALLEFVRKF